jgi:hypothetical protein
MERHAFQRDHFQLNKFRNPEEEDFQVLCQTLRGFVDVAIRQMHQPREESM